MSRLMLHPVVGRIRSGSGGVNFVVIFAIFGTFFGWIQAGKVEPGNVYTFQSYTDGHVSLNTLLSWEFWLNSIQMEYSCMG